MLRNILAVVGGCLVGSALNMGLIQLNMHVLFPMPAGTDMNDPEQFNAYVATLPTLAFVVVLFAHLGQSFVGGWVAARLGSSRPMLLAMIIGVLTLINRSENASALFEAEGLQLMSIFKGSEILEEAQQS